MHKNWRWNLHGHLALLPFTLLYAAFCFVVYGARSWGFKRGVILCIADLKQETDSTGLTKQVTRIWFRPSAQTIAGVSCYATSTDLADADLRAHEFSHIAITHIFALAGTFLLPIAFAAADGPVWLGMVLGGPAGFVAHGVAYVVHMGIELVLLWIRVGSLKRALERWPEAYRRIFSERIAYAIQRRYERMTPEQRAEVWT